MEGQAEKRRHRRVPLNLTVLCQQVGKSGGTVYAGNAVNASPGGVLVEFDNCKLRDGELVSVDMAVPPTEGLLKYGGRVSSYARVIRVGRQQSGTLDETRAITRAIALEFCEVPKLQV
ncbi:MAG: PilZ domain-containing protein [Planctomycetota bacterium]|jgi:hypothetical protein